MPKGKVGYPVDPANPNGYEDADTREGLPNGEPSVIPASVQHRTVSANAQSVPMSGKYDHAKNKWKPKGRK